VILMCARINWEGFLVHRCCTKVVSRVADLRTLVVEELCLACLTFHPTQVNRTESNL